MKNHWIALLSLAFVATVGCTVVDSSVKPPARSELSDTEREALLERQVELGDNILSAIRDEDYQDFMNILGKGPFAKEMTLNDFNTSSDNFKKQFGAITDFEFLTTLATPEISNLVWKITCERPSATPGGADIKQEVLFRLVIMEVEGQSEVLGMGFL